MTRTPLRLSVLAGAAALLLSGCGPVHAGAAATVGQDRIATSRLADVVDRGLQDQQAQQQFGADRPAFQRQVLSRMITSDLLAEAARRNDVSVTPGEVDARLASFAAQLGGQAQLEQQAAQSGIAKPDLRPFISDLTLNDKLADRLTAGEQVPASVLQQLYQQDIGQYDQVTARHILLKTQAEAQQVLAQVQADPSSFATIAAQRSLDEGSKVKGGDLGSAGRGTYVKEFEAALFAAKPGQFGIVKTQFGYHVYQLVARKTTTLAQATPELRRQALQQQRSAAVGQVLQQVSKELGVKVNPRFGRWDPEQGTVVEGTSSVSSPAPAGAPGADTGLPGTGGTTGGAQPQAPVASGEPAPQGTAPAGQ